MPSHAPPTTVCVLARCVGAILIAGVPAASLYGQFYDWNNTGNSNAAWQLGSNWTPGGPPGPSDTATFSADRTYEVWWDSFTGNRQIEFLDVSAGNVTFLNQTNQLPTLTLSGNGYSGFELTGVGTSLRLSGIHIHTMRDGVIKPGTSLFVDGAHPAGSRLTVDKDLRVSGSMDVTQGGVVDSNNTTLSGTGSDVRIAGVGSQMNVATILTTGFSADGIANNQLTIESGGLATANGVGIGMAHGAIGTAVDASGTMTVRDSGSQLQIGSTLKVGTSLQNSASATAWGALIVESGGYVSSGSAELGFGINGHGSVVVSGTGSQWQNTGNLNVGFDLSGTGNLRVEDGGLVTNDYGYLGAGTSTLGSAVVTGSNSRWETANALYVGHASTGDLLVEQGGVVTSDRGSIGHSTGSVGTARVTGTGSGWDNNVRTFVGLDGNGSLTIDNGGQANNGDAYIGYRVGSVGNVVVTDSGSAWNNNGFLMIGGSDTANGGAGSLTVDNGGRVSVGGVTRIRAPGSLNLTDGELVTGGFDHTHGGTFNFTGGQLTVNAGTFDVGAASFTIESPVGQGPTLAIRDSGTASFSAALTVGSAHKGNLIVEAGGTVTSLSGSIGQLAGSSGVALVRDTGSKWTTSSGMAVGNSGQGTLRIENGGLVLSGTGYIGYGTTGVGAARVTGTDSRWINFSNGGINVGHEGNGTLIVEYGGSVSSGYLVIGRWGSATGNVTIQGTGSQLETNFISTGSLGNGALNILQNGTVVSTNARIADILGSTGVVNVSGGGRWEIGYDLSVGGGVSSGGNGTLNVENGGLVQVGNETRIWSTGSVNLLGGRLEFGKTTLAEFAAINAVSGSLAGRLDNTGYTNAASLTALQNHPVDVSDVSLFNSGTLYGNATLDVGVNNLSAGELQAVAGERLRFGGRGNINSGEINNYGGSVLFAQDLTNTGSGFVAGHGLFEASGGWSNQGVVALSGTSDIAGDFVNSAGGRVVTSGGGITTFYDDVQHNGTEIRTALDSATVFFGSVAGAGAFTGGGTVFFEGDLRPGNSPDVLTFEGDLAFGSGAATFLEIAGLDFGDFDRLEIDGDLALDGLLSVDLIDGFQLLANQEFLIADVGGLLSGQFFGLTEGAEVASFGGRKLFISYTAGNGNDIALFTAVPEPGFLVPITVCLIGLGCFHRRRANSIES